MNTEPQYLYYNETDGTWQPCTLADLANLNNPDLPICPLNPDGTPGPQTTYAAISNRAIARATLNADKLPAQNLWHKKHPLHTILPFLRPLNTEQNLNYTLNYIRAIINLGINLISIGLVYKLTRPIPVKDYKLVKTGDFSVKNVEIDLTPPAMHPMLVILIGLLIGCTIIFILQHLTKPSTRK